MITEPLKVLEIREKSVKVKLGEGSPFWLPKSQIEEPEVEDIEVGDEEEFTIPRWLADKLGLE